MKSKETYIVINSLTSLYLIYWDLRVDWNLINFKKKHFLLRSKILFPKWLYYFAIFSNLILRLTWIISLFEITSIDEEMLFFILCFLEVYRRLQWVLIRVENEQLNNPEFYRDYLFVPDLPENY